MHLHRSWSWVLISFVVSWLPDTGAWAQEIWFAPQQDAVDRLDLFKPDASWKKAASHTQIYKFYANKAFNTPPQEEVELMIKDLNRRGIAIALEAGVLNVAAKPPPVCGGWGLVEGYGPVALHELIAKKIKQAGGVVKYIAMDEPLFYGHYFKGKPRGQPGCQSSIREVAALAAQSLAVYIREFPGVVIGDTEPSNALTRQPNWQDDFATWTTEFRAATGRPLAFLQIDAAWAEPGADASMRAVYAYAQGLMRKGQLAKIGIIYNGNPGDASDAGWVASARAHIDLVEHTYGFHPDQAVFQSWHKYPTHTLPETSPETLTGLIDFYIERRK
jgi:hypothetical protein